MIKNPKLWAYSLIELLVVMAIISTLIVLGYSVMVMGIKRARDTLRLKAVNGIQVAIEGYRSKKGTFPQCTTNDNGLPTGNYTAACYIEHIDPEALNILDQTFKSPINNSNSTAHAMAYYYNDTDKKYAVCALTETVHQDNQRTNFYTPPSGVTGGCFCVGVGAEDIKCYGLTDPNG